MDFLNQLRGKIAEKIQERQAKQAELDTILAAPSSEARDLNDDEAAKFATITTEIRAIDADLGPLNERREILEAEKAQRDAVAGQFRSLGIEQGAVGGVRVVAEARTYNPQNDRNGGSFLLDVARRHLGDWDAAQRLGRHMQEERVERGIVEERAATTTSAFAGLVVPQYLVDLVAPAAAAGRPFANICNHHDLPPVGNTVNISRITTATSAAVQTEGSAVSETNIDDTLLTETMFTVAGQQTLTRQAIDRGIGTEEVTLNDLFRRYHTNLDSKLINDATTGLTNTAGTVAYTDASPTAPELYPKILSAQSAMEAVFLDQGVGNVYAVMHSRRWAWMQSQVSSSWPFIGQPGYGVQAGGANFATGYGMGVRGVLPNGIQVIVDNNIATNLGAGTNEDEIYLVNAAELHLWEDPAAPVFIRAEQTAAASLGVLLVVYGYAAYSFRRYSSGHQKIAGTGLVTPTF